MRLKGRVVYGVQIEKNVELDNYYLYVNFGEGRFAGISWENFLKNVSSWKIDNENKKMPLLDNPNFYGFRDVSNIIENISSFIKIEGRVIHFQNGQYLIETGEFVKLKDGATQYKHIATVKGFDIKLQLNGTNGFAIFKDNKCLEDRLWSIKDCKTAIEAMV